MRIYPVYCVKPHLVYVDSCSVVNTESLPYRVDLTITITLYGDHSGCTLPTSVREESLHLVRHECLCVQLLHCRSLSLLCLRWSLFAGLTPLDLMTLTS